MVLRGFRKVWRESEFRRDVYMCRFSVGEGTYLRRSRGEEVRWGWCPEAGPTMNETGKTTLIKLINKFNSPKNILETLRVRSKTLELIQTKICRNLWDRGEKKVY